MKKIVYFLLIVLLAACNGNKTQKTGPKGETGFEVNEEIHNFGTLKAGEVVAFSFVFTNSGPNDMVVDSVICGCNCVQARYMREPVAPGGKLAVEVEFDTSGLFGSQYKSVEVYGNIGQKAKQLAVVADVINDEIQITY